MTDLWFRFPVDWLSRRMAARGDQVWRYEFGFGSPGSDKPPEHTSEMAYVYHSAPADAAFGRWPPVQRYWVNFIRTGNPNGPGLPHWPQVGRSDAYLGFDPEEIAVGHGLCRAICALPYHDVNHPRSPALGIGTGGVPPPDGTRSGCRDLLYDGACVWRFGGAGTCRSGTAVPSARLPGAP